MGQEISAEERLDVDGFRERLRQETKVLMSWFRERNFENPATPKIGLELEAWLIDADGFPVPRNLEFIEMLSDPAIVPELGAFNFEYNGEPASLTGDVFGQLEAELNEMWARSRVTAQALGMQPLMIGIPPNLRPDMMTLEYMTPSNRYRLLNQRLFELRDGKPLKVDITGRDPLEMAQDNVMLEAACTSFQVHLMLTQDNAARHYNAAQIASSPLVAISANAPFLYGHRLWEETRIAAFEAAVYVPGQRDRTGRRASRVTFGSQYVRHSLLELFLENLDGYEPFLPMVSDTDQYRLAHLKLQNGTVWRWNRPIVHAPKVGTPHLRLENRVIPAGPTIVDMVANMAFCIGLTLSLAKEDDLEARLPFETARANFYDGARLGLRADITWLDGETINLQRLIHDKLCARAEAALIEAGIDSNRAHYYMEIIHDRARNGQTGAAWQRAHANCNGQDFQRLILDYRVLQDEGRPVHSWQV